MMSASVVAAGAVAHQRGASAVMPCASAYAPMCSGQHVCPRHQPHGHGVCTAPTASDYHARTHRSQLAVTTTQQQHWLQAPCDQHALTRAHVHFPISLWAKARLPVCATHGHAQLLYLTGRVVVTFPSYPPPTHLLLSLLLLPLLPPPPPPLLPPIPPPTPPLLLHRAH